MSINTNMTALKDFLGIGKFNTTPNNKPHDFGGFSFIDSNGTVPTEADVEASESSNAASESRRSTDRSIKRFQKDEPRTLQDFARTIEQEEKRWWWDDLVAGVQNFFQVRAHFGIKY